MYICYKTPAAQNFSGWKERAIPLGNGSIGVKVFGGVQREVIQFNEKTLFSGDIEKVGSYQNFGELFLTFNAKVPCSENAYLRDLDLETGSSMVACQKGLDGQTRHCFVSAADNVFVEKIEATGEAMLDFTLSLQSEQNGEVSYDGAYAYIKGTVNANNGVAKESGEDKNSLEYVCCVKVIPYDGEMTTDSDGITVKDTFGAKIIMSCATAYFDKSDLDKCVECVEKASEEPFARLYKTHIEDYKKIMGRTVLNIGQSDENVTTDNQLRLYSKGKYKSDIEALLFEMGKYILYASSRRRSLPMTQCGIWNSLNKQENGENILIDTVKLKSAMSAAKTLNMEEICVSFDDFCEKFPFGKRYNPFGASESVVIEKESKRKSAFSKLFSKEKTPANAGALLKKASELSKINGNEKEFAEKLSLAAMCASDTLMMPDIFDNITYTETVCNAVITSENGIIRLLTCLPHEWEIGSLSGVRVNGCEVSVVWSGRRLKSGSVKADKDGICKIECNGKFIGVCDENGNDVKEEFTDGVVSFEALAGRTYSLY